MKKFALITGASGGIGRATALELAKKGWNLYLHYNKNKEELEKLLFVLKDYQVELIPIQADLTSAQGINKLLESIFQIDAICYVSGVSHYGMFMDIEEETMEEMWKIHVKAPMILIKSLLPKLSRNEQSRIVLISSIWGQTGASCEIIYSTVKGAQISFVKALSKEIARNNILVNAVAPGAVRTRMLEGFTNEEIDNLSEEIPLGRLAEADEVAGAISFLLSESASYITGQVLSVNGGWYT